MTSSGIEVEAFPKQMLQPIPGIATPTSLVLNKDLPIERWIRLLPVLRALGEANPWWVGDAVRDGEKMYGEMYSQALEETGLTYGTLKTYVNVAEAFSDKKTGEPKGRVEGLSFAHHQTVAYLTEKQRQTWLDHAKAGGWTVAELRAQLREAGLTKRQTGGHPGKTPLDKAIDALEKARALMFDLLEQDAAISAITHIDQTLELLGVREVEAEEAPQAEPVAESENGSQ